MEVKYKRTITFFEARKIVESDMKENTYANVAQKESPSSSSNIMTINTTTTINNNNDQHRSLIEKKTTATRTKWLAKILRTVNKNHTQLKSVKHKHKLNKINLQQTPYRIQIYHRNKYHKRKITQIIDPPTNSQNRSLWKNPCHKFKTKVNSDKPKHSNNPSQTLTFSLIQNKSYSTNHWMKTTENIKLLIILI